MLWLTSGSYGLSRSPCVATRQEGPGLYWKIYGLSRSRTARSLRTWRGFLADPANAELLLHRVQDRADFLHGFLDLLRLRFQGARPVIERLGLELDERGVGRVVSRSLVGHGHRTARARAGSSEVKRP